MGFVDKILGGIGFERKSLSDLEAFFSQTAVTSSGVQADPISAMRCPAVAAAVRIRTETLSNLSLKLYRRGGGAKEVAGDHPLHRIIHSWSSPWASSAQLIKTLEFDCLTHGQGFALAVRAGDRIVELHRIKPSTVTVEFGDGLEPSYRVSQKNGGTKTYHLRDVLHVQSLDGKSPIKKCAEAIGLALSLERHMAQLLAKGARPSGVLTSPKGLDDVAFRRLTTSWRGAHSGENAGGTAVLEDGTDFKAVTFSSVDMEFMSARQFAVIEIGRALGVPPNLLFDFTRQTYSNSEDASQAYLTHTILGRCTEFQDAFNRLLSEEERDTYFAEFSTDSLVKADLAARYEAYSKAIASRFLNPNEVRAYENLPPYDGGDAYAIRISTLRSPAKARRREEKHHDAVFKAARSLLDMPQRGRI